MPKGVWDRSKSEATQRYLDTIRLSPDEEKISMKAAQERYNARYPERRAEQQRRAHFKSNYGLTLEDLQALIDVRGGACDICHRVPEVDSKGRTLRVDHDHDTGEVRGLLCNGCNLLLGHAGDSIELLAAAIQYLTRSFDE